MWLKVKNMNVDKVSDIQSVIHLRSFIYCEVRKFYAFRMVKLSWVIYCFNRKRMYGEQ